ncbi:hypothetical protein BDV06DRAFT_172162 [Aspergillus oleicola]
MARSNFLHYHCIALHYIILFGFGRLYVWNMRRLRARNPSGIFCLHFATCTSSR